MEIVRCKRCNTILKAEKSRKLGYGRTCARIHLLQEANKPKNTIDFEREFIILKEQIDMMGKYIRIQEITKPEPEVNNSLVLDELLNRVKKLELDNNFMKCQLKHKSFVGKSNDSKLDWDIPKEVKEVKKVYEIKFNVIIKELKVIFTENFDYHDILKPILNEVVITSPILA